MKEKLRVEGDIKHYLVELSLVDAEKTCKNHGSGRFWSNSRFIYSSERMDPEFSLNISSDLNATLIHISSNDEIENGRFCVGEPDIRDPDIGSFEIGVVARGCV